MRAISSLVGDAFRTRTIDVTWPASEGAAGLARTVDRICGEATDAVLDGFNILILSDRAVSPTRIPMPALLATAAVHHHLIRRGLRTSTGLVVETGEAREVHHFCVLAGYGAEAINPYLAFETLEQIRVQNGLREKPYEVQKNYLKAVGKGVLKVMSKMGISTYQSYCGAQIFDAVGLSTDFVEKCFTGTASTIEGAGFEEIAREAVQRHQNAYGENPVYEGMLDAGGDYAFRLRGEDHAWTPDTVAKLQHAARGNSRDEFTAFTALINDQSTTAAHSARPDGVEVRRYTGAAGRGGAGGVDREAFCHGCDELWLDLARGAHHAGDRDEPHRRQVQHRRGRRGVRSLPAVAERRFRCAQPSSRWRQGGSA